MSDSEADIEMLSTDNMQKEKTEQGDKIAATANEAKNSSAKNENEDLTSTETLRESPVQWPERFPGMEEFLSLSETPIHTPNINAALFLSNNNKSALNKFARMPPEQLIDKIKAMHDEIYKLGLLESKEMTRGKLLGIFDRDRMTKTKGISN